VGEIPEGGSVMPGRSAGGTVSAAGGEGLCICWGDCNAFVVRGVHLEAVPGVEEREMGMAMRCCHECGKFCARVSICGLDDDGGELVMYHTVAVCWV